MTVFELSLFQNHLIQQWCTCLTRTTWRH